MFHWHHNFVYAMYLKQVQPRPVFFGLNGETSFLLRREYCSLASLGRGGPGDKASSMHCFLKLFLVHHDAVFIEKFISIPVPSSVDPAATMRTKSD